MKTRSWQRWWVLGGLVGLLALASGLDADAQLGESVAVVLDGGPTPGSAPSTILDATGERLRVIRLGALSLDELRAVADVAGPDAA